MSIMKNLLILIILSAVFESSQISYKLDNNIPKLKVYNVLYIFLLFVEKIYFGAREVCLFF